MQPLPVSEILSYVYHLLYIPKGYRANRMFRFIKAMDQAHMSWAAEKLKREQPKKPKK